MHPSFHSESWKSWAHSNECEGKGERSQEGGKQEKSRFVSFLGGETEYKGTYLNNANQKNQTDW